MSKWNKAINEFGQSITFCGFQFEMSGCQSIQWNWSSPFHSRLNPWLRIWLIENYFTDTYHGCYVIFIPVKYHFTDIEEEHRVESMNRYHIVNKHFCKIQRQVSKYRTMEIGHSDYQHVHTVLFTCKKKINIGLYIFARVINNKLMIGVFMCIHNAKVSQRIRQQI